MNESTRTEGSPGSGAGFVPTPRFVLLCLLLLFVPIAAFVTFGADAPVQATRGQLLALVALLVLRGIAAIPRSYRRQLVPPLDLPVIGLLFVFTGGRDTPLDPALFLIYALFAFYLERDPGRRRSGAYYAGFALGFAGMYGILVFHEWGEQRRKLDFQYQRIAASVQSFREGIRAIDPGEADEAFAAMLEYIRAERQADPAAANHPYFAIGREDAQGWRGGTLDRDYEEIRELLRLELEHLSRLVDSIGPDLGWEEAQAMNEAVNDLFNRTNREIDLRLTRMSDALEDLNRKLQDSPVDANPVAEWWGLIEDTVATPLRNLQSEVDNAKGTFHDFIRSDFYQVKRDEYDFRRDLRRLITERVGIAILVVAALSLTARLRFRFEEENRRREAARAELLQQEKENWIALTAGLTHTIGNEILAYDAYAEEALDAIADPDDRDLALVEHNLRFIYESNKARLGFIKFLDEFARARKAELDGVEAEPAGLQRIDLEPFLRRVRAHVGEVESADLPRDSRDPGVLAQRRKLIELPLEVVFARDGDRFVTAGRPGILHFFCYELIKNALRNASGVAPLCVEIEKRDGRVLMRFINDLAVVERRDESGTVGYILQRSSTHELLDEEGLRAHVERTLEHCFEPGRGGGTGLGLFLIRYFAREYYRGSITARIHDWDRRLVAFELDIPDDLAQARRIA